MDDSDKKGFFHIVWPELSYNTRESIKTIVKKEFPNIQLNDDYNNLRYINAIYYNNQDNKDYFNSEVQNDLAIELSGKFNENIHSKMEYLKNKEDHNDTYVEDTIDLILLQNFFFTNDLNVNIYLYYGVDEINQIKQYYNIDVNNIYITYIDTDNNYK